MSGRTGHDNSSVKMVRAALVGGLVAALVLGAMSMDDEMAELAKMLHDNCGEETGADLSLVERVNAGADLAGLGDGKFKCYIKCIMETAGMMSEGQVDVDAVLALLPDALRVKNEANLRACGTRPGADHCDIAYNTQVCWQQANKADYFLI